MSEALVTTEKIIKTDTRGRLRTTAERREFLLDEFERSAMTGRKFANWAGIRYSTFGNWSRARKKLRRAELATTTGPENTARPRWLEAVVKEPTLETQDRLKAGPLIVHGPGGVRLDSAMKARSNWRRGCCGNLVGARDAEFYREPQDLCGGGTV